MTTKYYGINDKWTDDEIENVIEVASEDGTVNSVKVNDVEYGGGGGGATATITIKDLDSYGSTIYGPFVSDGTNKWDAEFPGVTAAGSYINTDDGGTEWNAIVMLYEGVAMLQLEPDIVDSTVSGSLTKATVNIKVTGDGTINVIGE